MRGPDGRSELGARKGLGSDDMILDNLFTSFGGVGTAAMLVSILAFLGAPAIGAIACPMSQLRKLQPRGR